ncbi:MAG: ABC transporter permease [Lachnospiraceae bacterium]|nr:ABC transporter permease [Lachnospiraceae bacterium]
MNTSTILTIMKKELARFFGDHRMVFTTIIMPGLLIFVMYQFMGDAMISQFTTQEFEPKCKMVNLPEEWSDELTSMGFVCKEAQESELEKSNQLVKDQKYELSVVFPAKFMQDVEEYDIQSGKEAPRVQIYYNSASTDSATAYQTLTDFLDTKEASIANKFDVNPLQQEKNIYDLASEEDMTAKIFSSMLPFLLLTFLYSGCISVAPESIAGEKERGTMAALLITPTKRSHIALGKISALSLIAVLSGASSAIGTIASMPRLMADSVEQISGASYDVTDYLVLGVIILSTALVLVTLISLVSAIAKTIKEAQTYVTPLMILVMLVGITAMFGDGAKTELQYYCIPLYNSVQAMVQIFSFELKAAYIATTIAINLFVTGLGAVILAKMFDSEYVMFHK